MKQAIGTRTLMGTAVAAIMMMGVTIEFDANPFGLSLTPGVHAEEDGSGGSGGKGGKGTGYEGPHGMGKQGSDRPNDPVPGQGSGQGGPSGDSDAKGPRFGGGGSAPGEDDRGGRPVWAQEGVPEGDYGRLNVVRAPEHVIDRSLLEAYSNLSTSGTDLYTLDSLEAVIAAIESGDAYRVDSPLENLGLYRDLLSDSAIGNEEYPDIIVVNDDNLVTLAAIFLGSASDKTVEITDDTVTMVNTVLGLTLPEGVTAEQLADAADQVRVAVLTAHEN